MKNAINLQYAGCQFDVTFQRDALPYMRGEGIPQELVFQAVSDAMPVLFNSCSGKHHFLRSQKHDLALICISNYVGARRFHVEATFVFRLSAESLRFRYRGQRIAIFYEDRELQSCKDMMNRPIPEPVAPKKKKNPIFEKFRKKRHFPQVVCEASIHIRNEKPPFMLADGFATVFTFLDKLIDYHENSDLILSDITDLCLYPHREDDTLCLEIIAIIGTIHTI